MSIPDRLLKRTDRLSSQIIRYLFVGGIAFVADFAAMVATTEGLDLHYSWGATVGFAVGLTVNYLLSIFWVFSRRSVGDGKLEFLIFALVGVVGLGLTQGILWVGEEWLSIDYRIAKLAAVVLVLAWNFSARKFLLFRESVPENSAVVSASPEGNL